MTISSLHDQMFMRCSGAGFLRSTILEARASRQGVVADCSRRFDVGFRTFQSIRLSVRVP